MELQESFTASIMAQIQTLWERSHASAEFRPSKYEPRQFMAVPYRNSFPGWIKTVNGWVREEDFDAAQAAVVRRAQEDT